MAGADGASGAVDALQRVLRGHEVHLEEHQYGTRSSLVVTVPWAGLPSSCWPRARRPGPRSPT